MKPYYDKDGITIYHGDCANVWQHLDPHSFDMLLTDPPYSSGGAMRGDRIQNPSVKYVKTGSSSLELGSFTGDTRDQLSFLWWVSAWLHGYAGTLKPGAISAFFTDWRQLPAAVMALQCGGLVYRGIVNWHKPDARPVQGRWTNTSEYVVWGTSGPRPLEGSAFPGQFTCSSPRERSHITEKPISVLMGLLEIVPTGGAVLDPFMGSGTTLVAAKQSGLRAVGVELEEKYCEVAVERLRQQVLL